MANRDEYTVAVGDTVQVYWAGLWQDCLVEKVGTKLVHIKMYSQTYAYRLDGQQSNNVGNSHFRTLKQADDHRREIMVVRDLQELGIEFRLGARWTLSQMEQLLAVAKEIRGASKTE